MGTARTTRSIRASKSEQTSRLPVPARMTRRILLALAVLAALASPVGAQVTATLPVTCSGSTCIQAQPVVNPDGSLIAATVGTVRGTLTDGSRLAEPPRPQNRLFPSQLGQSFFTRAKPTFERTVSEESRPIRTGRFKPTQRVHAFEYKETVNLGVAVGEIFGHLAGHVGYSGSFVQYESSNRY